MHAPQIILSVLMAFGVARDIEKHGKPYQKTEHIGVSLLACAIKVALLWWGGFWSQR